MGKPFEEMNTFDKLQYWYTCIIKGDIDSSLRNYFWELTNIIYNYEQKHTLLVTKDELSKVKFFNIKLMRVYNFPEDYLEDIENFNALESKIRENDAGTTI